MNGILPIVAPLGKPGNGNPGIVPPWIGTPVAPPTAPRPTIVEPAPVAPFDPDVPHIM